MPQRITGIDIGHDSVKAVSLSGTLKGYQVRDAVLVKIDEAGGIKEALEKVFQKEAFQGSSCVTTLPLERFSFRHVRLPFKDNKKISQILPYELEQTIPYTADEAVIDSLVLRQSDETELLAAAVRADDLAERIELLAPHAPSVSIIDAETVPLGHWFMEESDDAILLDIGSVRTSLLIICKGRITNIRSLPLGGNRVTMAVAENLGIEQKEAERKKCSGAAETEQATVAFCRDLYNEVKNTLELLRFRGVLQEMPPRLYLAGGGSQSRFLKNELERLFALVPRDVAPPPGISFQFAKDLRRQWNPAVMNQALALALREARGGRGFNFARGRFASAGFMEKFRDELPWLGPLAAGILLLLGINLYLDYRSDNRYIESMRRETSRIFSQTLPEVTRIVDPVHQMRTAITAIQRAATGRERGKRPVTVLSILRDISRLVPESVDFLITNFTYDEHSIRIQGETDNFNTVDTIKTSLERGDAFKAVAISSANLMRQGGRVSFDLRMEPNR